MIRPLHEGDRSAALALLSAAPHLNLYLLGNMAALGFDADFCRFWGDFDGSRLRGVVNLYMTGWTIYGEEDANWSDLAQVIDAHPQDATRLQDNPGGRETILSLLSSYEAVRISESTLMSLAPEDFRPLPAPAGVHIRRATGADLPALVDFYAHAEDMSRQPEAVERPLLDRRVWIAERAGTIAAAALTNAETDKAAMIGGVYTPPPMRGQGLSKAVCSSLCEELLQHGLEPVLYWDNPAAGAVYRRLGFGPRGAWRSVRMRRRA